MLIPGLRHLQPGLGRQPRGASRLAPREPLKLQWPSFSLDGAKRVAWPLLLVALLAGSYLLVQRLLPYADRPVAQVVVEGELGYVSRETVQQRIAPYVERTFFDVDLPGLRHELEQMPWIARADVRRVWPDQVRVRLDEQLPIARWGNDLLNGKGEAFAPSDPSRYEHLPQLYGPQRAQQRVMQQYQLLSQMLRPMGFTIASLELHERGSWFLTTRQGIELLLGRDQLVEKIRRFGTVYRQALEAQRDNIARVDLRYANGLAVAWHDPAAAAAAGAAGSAKH